MQLARKGFLEDGLLEFGEIGELLLVSGSEVLSLQAQSLYTLSKFFSCILWRKWN